MEVQQFSNAHTPIVFYPRRAGVLVTDAWFCAHGQRFAVKDLGRLRWRQGSTKAERRVAVRVVLVGAILVATTVVALGASQLTILAATGYTFLATAMVLFSIRHWPTPLHLWAVHHGSPTVVYTSTDRTEFHQVLRALVRATELQSPVP